LLLPLAKSRVGDDMPEFALEIVYLLPGTSWADKGHLKLALPALDLPISRTGLQIFYPPLFRLSSEPGSFHSENFANPISTVLTAAVYEPPVNAPLPTAKPIYSGTETTSGLSIAGANSAMLDKDAKQVAAQSQSLVDKFHANERGARASGILPVHVEFPAFGPSLYLVSELTSENQSASAELTYQQDKKAGGK